MAIDDHNDLYVDDPNANTVSEFAPGSTTPIATISGLANPTVLAINGLDNLFVLQTAYNGLVGEYAPGTTTAGFTLGSFYYPTAVTFDLYATHTSA